MKNTSAGIQKPIVKKDALATGFAGEHALPANMQFAEEDAALKEMTTDIEGRIASGTLSRAEVRLLRNRLSAARSRFRKRHFLNILESQVSKLEKEKAALAQELEAQRRATEQAAKDAAHLRTVLASLIPEGNGSPVIAEPSPSDALTAVSPLMAELPQVQQVQQVQQVSPATSPAPLAPRDQLPVANKDLGSPVLDFLWNDWTAATASVADIKQEDAVVAGSTSPVMAPTAAGEDTDAWLTAYLGPATSF